VKKEEERKKKRKTDSNFNNLKGMASGFGVYVPF